MKTIFLLLAIASLPSTSLAAAYCGTVEGNRIIDGRFDPYFSRSQLSGLSEAQRNLVSEGNCICLSGRIEEFNDPAAGEDNRWYNSFTHITLVRARTGCAN